MWAGMLNPIIPKMRGMIHWKMKNVQMAINAMMRMWTMVGILKPYHSRILPQ